MSVPAHTAAGLDGLPAGVLKSFGRATNEQLAGLFTGIAEGAPIPRDWHLGRVVFVQKKGGQVDIIEYYRSLTVTRVLYRLLAGIIKEWISRWAEARHLLTEMQNSFRPGRRQEDNLFVHSECVAIAKTEQRSLLCCFLDVEKAYDNVQHAALFDCLCAMEIPATLLSIVQHLYRSNTVITHFWGVESAPIKVTRGLRQGCPLSPLLYILYVANLESKLLSSGLGFQLKFSTEGVDQRCRLPGLAFADDLVLMAECSQDLQALINICQVEITRLGLCFNWKKSALVPIAGPGMDEGYMRLRDEVLMVCSAYLDVQISSRPELCGHQEDIFHQKALRAQCILCHRCLWRCNRFVMVRGLWKIVHMPALTYANAVLCLSAPTREWLERRQRKVGRIALGCHGAVANETLQGDLGWSSVEAREAVSKITYRGRLLYMPRERSGLPRSNVPTKTDGSNRDENAIVAGRLWGGRVKSPLLECAADEDMCVCSCAADQICL